MTTTADIKDGVTALYEEGRALAARFCARKGSAGFDTGYQRWYTRALPLVKSLAPDRYAEFRSHYEIDSTLR